MNLLNSTDIQLFLGGLSSSWKLDSEGKKLLFSLKPQNFNESLEMAQTIAKIADEYWHHPELVIGFKKFELEIFTHDSGGLTQADFDFAKEVDLVFGL